MLRELTDSQRRRQCGCRLREMERLTHIRRAPRPASTPEIPAACPRRPHSASATGAIHL